MVRMTKAQKLSLRTAAFVGTVVGGLEAMLDPAASKRLDVNAWQLDTKFGSMSLHVYGDWVACVFTQEDQAKLAAAYLNSNPHNGKWNHLFTGFPNVEAAKLDGRYFLNQLRRVLPNAKPLPPQA